MFPSVQSKALLATGHAARSCMAMRAELEQQPKHPLLLLMAAKACLQAGPLHIAESIQYCRRALEVTEREVGHAWLHGRAQGVLGLALVYAGRAPGAVPGLDPQAAQIQALRHLQAAYHMDSDDLHVTYNLALLLAEARRLGEALQLAEAGLERSAGSHGPSWVLLVQITTALQRHEQALTLLSAALQEAGPLHATTLLRIQARLQDAQHQPAEALRTLARAQAAASAASTGENTLAEQQQTLQVWLDMAAVLIRQHAFADAAKCISQASSSSAPHGGPDLLCAEGQLSEEEGRVGEAVRSYQAALAKDPHHSPSALALGTLLAQPGSHQEPSLAEVHLLDALRWDPRSHQGWFQLGQLCRNQKQAVAAEQHLRKAAALVLTAPILPFRDLPFLLALDHSLSV
ncbi:hypothetical protein WJX84_003498 [Apatococcus fuscideae]|uniref:Tetratricopeptide repeat protein 7B n=1 Tax=Apatococcus fuscideae TaxID=2026836 RepID=A0AAW1SIB5_9CHLO